MNTYEALGAILGLFVVIFLLPIFALFFIKWVDYVEKKFK